MGATGAMGKNHPVDYTDTNNSNNDVDNNTLKRPDETENKMIDINVESNGEEDGATSKAQPKKCENQTSNTDIENIFSKVTHVVEGLSNDQFEEAKTKIAMIAEVMRQGHKRSHTWVQKHHASFFQQSMNSIKYQT